MEHYKPALLAQHIALAAINFYKQYVSPHKGFSCAYRAYTGRASCSTVAYRAIQRYGLFRGYAVLRERTYRCGVAQRRYSQHPLKRPSASQRGDCDPGCLIAGDGCDLPGGRVFTNACDALSCCDFGSCDWTDNKTRQRRKKDEKKLHIPPEK